MRPMSTRRSRKDGSVQDFSRMPGGTRSLSVWWRNPPSGRRLRAPFRPPLWRAGSEIIVQGAFRAEGWGGRTDILRRVDIPSDLGAWSYVIIDTKLARETKGGTVLQLCLYSDLLGIIQNQVPEFAYVVVPG